MSNSLRQLFQDRNRQTCDGWETFAGHREQVRRLLEQHAPPQARSLCVLGAGNTNDLDLPWLAQRFERIVLVDVDYAAMRSGVARQLGDGAAFVSIAVQDVTGVFDLLNMLTPSQPIPLEAESRLGVALGEILLPVILGEQFDCVLSTCLLSQLIDGLKTHVGEGHPRFIPLVLAVRRQHLKTLLQLTCVKGLAICVFDFVSSLTCPEIGSIPTERIEAYAAEQVARGNFFTGLKPPLVLRAWEDLLAEASPASSSFATPPWRWNLGPRTYLVSSVVARLG